MWSVAEGSVGNGWSGADVLSQPNLQEAKQEPYDSAYRQCACRHGNTTAEQVTEEEGLHPSGDLLRGGSGGSDTTAKGMRSFWRHFLRSAEVLAQHCLLPRTWKGTFFNRKQWEPQGKGGKGKGKEPTLPHTHNSLPLQGTSQKTPGGQSTKKHNQQTQQTAMNGSSSKRISSTTRRCFQRQRNGHQETLFRIPFHLTEQENRPPVLNNRKPPKSS